MASQDPYYNKQNQGASNQRSRKNAAPQGKPKKTQFEEDKLYSAHENDDELESKRRKDGKKSREHHGAQNKVKDEMKSIEAESSSGEERRKGKRSKNEEGKRKKGGKKRQQEEEVVMTDINAEDFIAQNCRFANDSQSQESYDDEEEGSESEEEESFENFYDVAEDGSADYSSDSQSNVETRHPVEFAKSHMLMMEADMNRTHERHMKLMREMDENYRMIEAEAQEYYVEFIQKWKDLAKNKINQYRKTIEQLGVEKEALARQKEGEIEVLKEKIEALTKDTAKERRDQLDQIEEMESIQNRLQEDLAQKDRLIQQYKRKCDEKDSKVEALTQDLAQLQEKLKHAEEDMEAQMERAANEHHNRVEQLEQELQKAHTEKLDMLKNLGQLQQKLAKMESQKHGLIRNEGAPLKINVKQLVGQKVRAQGLSESGRNQAQDQKLNIDSSGQNVSKVFFKKDQIQIQNISKRVVNIGATNNSFIAQVPTNLEMSQNYSTQPSQDTKAKEDQIAVEYQQKVHKIHEELKPLAAQMQNWKKEMQEKKQQNPAFSVQSDPLYSQYLRYKELIEQKRQLLVEKQKRLEEIKKVPVQTHTSESKEESKTSARGSKSYSPRKYVSIKQNQGSYFNNAFNNLPQEEQLRILKVDVEKLHEEKELLTKENKNGSDVLASLEAMTKLLSDSKMVDSELREQFSKGGGDQFDKLMKDNQALKDRLLKIESSYRKIVETMKSQQVMVNQLKQKMMSASLTMSGEASSAIQQDNSMINSESHKNDDELSNVNSVNLKEQTEALEQQIEERVKNTLEAKFKIKMQEFEKKAREGLRQREEAIEKQKMQLMNYSREIENLKNKLQQQNQSYQQSQKQLDKIKNGEELFKQQYNSLKLENEKIWSKYEQELVQRKRLHNIIEDMKGKIRVFCRVRPINEQERNAGHIPVVTIVDHFTVKIKFKANNSISQDEAGRGGGYQEKEFTYDACFGPRSQQEEIFEDTKMLLQSAFDGFNVCIFAYGQTGSGKTFTIQGDGSSPGIVPRAIQELFAIKQRMETNDRYRVSFQCYMVELYCNNLIDLLGQETQGPNRNNRQNNVKLDIKEDPQTGMVFIQNLNKLEVNSFQEASAIYEKGISSRKVNSTDMNAVSSRSHVIFSIVVETINNDTQQRSKGKISFVDLAGSERMDKSNPNVNRLKEMNSINQSLKALGDVIQNLSSGSHRSHIPYRNNKLTHLMKDSIGGNSKTLMFVNIAPTDYDSQESRMSLFFGDRVKLIQNEAQKNTESQELAQLKDENQLLKKQLAQHQAMNTGTTKNNTLGTR